MEVTGEMMGIDVALRRLDSKSLVAVSRGNGDRLEAYGTCM
jgi:hypothetical protein